MIATVWYHPILLKKKNIELCIDYSTIVNHSTPDDDYTLLSLYDNAILETKKAKL